MGYHKVTVVEDDQGILTWRRDLEKESGTTALKPNDVIAVGCSWVMQVILVAA